MVPNTTDKRFQLQFSSFLTGLSLLTHGVSSEPSMSVTLPDPATIELRASWVILTGVEGFWMASEASAGEGLWMVILEKISITSKLSGPHTVSIFEQFCHFSIFLRIRTWKLRSRILNFNSNYIIPGPLEWEACQHHWQMTIRWKSGVEHQGW